MNLHPFFTAESLAVIGISHANENHPANVIYNKNLLRYPLRVFPVNPQGGELQGEKVFSALGNIKSRVDVAVIAVRAGLVQGVLQECIDMGVGGAIVISGGFAETGRHDLQEALTRTAAAADFPIIGPNCLGLFVPGKMDTFFLPSERMVHPGKGNVAVISQSGGILVDLLIKFHAEGIGLSSAVSIGNKAYVREEHLLDYFAGDPQTGVIALYIEGFARDEGRRFVKAAEKCPKPVVVMKAGKTTGGSRAVSSHTASLAGDHRVFSDVAAQHGIREAKNELELLSFCESLSYYPQTSASRIGIVSSSGGHGAMAVDSCLAHGLKVPDFSEGEQAVLREKMSEGIRSIAAVGNPVDLTGSAREDDFFAATLALAAFSSIDCILLLLLPYLPGISPDLGARLSLIRKKTGKPLIAYVPHVEKYRMLFEGLEINHVPASSSIEGAVLMAKALRRSI
ncbi:MAG: CoA-binding protein [Desulfobulbaceae bacterium]|nr:CoA-binding protein [Desulfobulbaceae bacterium]